MAVRMTHLVWRKGWAYFRFRLPDDLRGSNAPAHLPEALSTLINAKTQTFKHEVWESLRLGKDKAAQAKRIVSRRIGPMSAMVDEARLLIKAGPRSALSAHEVDTVVARIYADALFVDEEVRKRGFGFDIGAGDAGLRIPTGESPAPRPGLPLAEWLTRLAAVPPMGMTADDLKVMRLTTDKTLAALRDAFVRRQPPQRTKDRVAVELARLGAAPRPQERHEIELRVLQAEVRAWTDIAARLTGEIIPTPQVIAAAGRSDDPTLRAAFDLWKTGVGNKKGTVPRPNSVLEADAAVRRFIELHGNLRLSAVKRSHARAFRDAMAKLPKHLPRNLASLPLPRLLDALPEGLPLRSANTVDKALRLMSAVASAIAGENDFSERPGGWSNPFDGITVTGPAEEDRDVFDVADLKAIFSSPVFTRGVRPAGGRGEAAFWFPLIALFTGARLEEIAQLHVRDVQHLPENDVWFFDITDRGEGQRLKVGAMNRRKVPIHRELVLLGFLDFVDTRRTAGSDIVLFPGFELKEGADKRSAPWSKWFGRYLRKTVGIVDPLKVFHSFRHTFKDACRNAEPPVPDEHHDQLTSHAAKGRNVGRGYGRGASVATLNASLQRVRYPGLDLSSLAQAQGVR